MISRQHRWSHCFANVAAPELELGGRNIGI